MRRFEVNMNDLEARLARLSDKELAEAATFYLSDEVAHADPPALLTRLKHDVQSHGGDPAELEGRLDAVMKDRAATSYLLRDVLGRAAHGTDAERKRLTEALDGINQTQIAVELAFAIYAASVVTVVWLAMPPKKVTTTRTEEQRPDGSTVVTTKSEVEEMPPPVKELYGWIKDLFGGAPAKTE
jgi:hypothetical protein